MDDKVTVFQRGILFTILLCKDADSEIWDFKVKKKLKINNPLIKEDMISLHERKFIDWKGYKNAKKNIEKQEVSPAVIEVINFMNNLYGRNFNPNGENTVRDLRHRLNEVGVEDCKRVVSNRWESWKDSTTMRKHLNPGTIFRASKFEKYLEDVRSTRTGEAYVEAEKWGLKHEEEISVFSTAMP